LNTELIVKHGVVMNKYQVLITISLFSFFCVIKNIHSAPIQWTISEGGNGHWYDAICTSYVSWTDANAIISLQSNGYLATITSDNENVFILTHFDIAANGYGFGGYQIPDADEPGGGWRWITDEPWQYSNWNPYTGEPNDLGGEDTLAFHGSNFGYWNDLDSESLENLGFIIEYNEPPVYSFDFSTVENPTIIPLPSAFVLFSPIVLSFFAWQWRGCFRQKV
jgi:hypothetical protein